MFVRVKKFGCESILTFSRLCAGSWGHISLLSREARQEQPVLPDGQARVPA
jgi:hypothetical protein